MERLLATATLLIMSAASSLGLVPEQPRQYDPVQLRARAAGAVAYAGLRTGAAPAPQPTPATAPPPVAPAAAVKQERSVLAAGQPAQKVCDENGCRLVTPAPAKPPQSTPAPEYRTELRQVWHATSRRRGYWTTQQVRVPVGGSPPAATGPCAGGSCRPCR